MFLGIYLPEEISLTPSLATGYFGSIIQADTENLFVGWSSHFPIWRDAVAKMVAEPRRGATCANVFPDSESWR